MCMTEYWTKAGSRAVGESSATVVRRGIERKSVVNDIMRRALSYLIRNYDEQPLNVA